MGDELQEVLRKTFPRIPISCFESVKVYRAIVWGRGEVETPRACGEVWHFSTHASRMGIRTLDACGNSCISDSVICRTACNWSSFDRLDSSSSSVGD